MPVGDISAPITVDPERLRLELADTHFDADEFLESYIKQSSVQPQNTTSPSSVSVGSENAVDTTSSDPYLLHFHHAAEYGYDPDRLLQRLDNLFEACVHVNAKALFQHRHAGAELTRVEDDAVERLEQRGDMVKRRLAEVDALEDDLTALSRKFGHLGIVIATMMEPQERLKAVHKLLSHFMDLNNDELAEITYPELIENRATMEDYQHAADTLVQLKNISKTLSIVKDNPYQKACEKITALYQDIEGDLVALFVRAHQEAPMDINLMQQSAAVTQNFSVGYSQIISGFVQRSTKADHTTPEDPFRRIVHICDNNYKLIYEVFPSPDAVMEKFMTYVICTELENLIRHNLDQCPDTVEGREMYLIRMSDFYKRIKQLEGPLSKFNGLRMHSVLKILLGHHVDEYPKAETRYFRNRCGAVIQQYYDILGQDFGGLKLGVVQIRADAKDEGPVAAWKGVTLMADYLNSKPEVVYEKKILSETVVLSILNELKHSSARALTLLTRTDLANCLLEMGQTAIRHIFFLHLEYGLDVGLRMLPPLESKAAEPNMHFLKLIRLVTDIYELVDNQLNDNLKRLQRFKAHARKLDAMLKLAKERLETKVIVGMEYLLNAGMNWIQVMLSQQRKMEYTMVHVTATNTAKRVSSFFGKFVHLLNSSVDGGNRQMAAAEVGLRYHREILDHLEAFRYSAEDGMVVICEMKEYRESTAFLRSPAIAKLFDDTLLLCNILVTEKSNLSKMSIEISLEIDTPAAIPNFLRLREDFMPPPKSTVAAGQPGACGLKSAVSVKSSVIIK